MPDDQTNTSVVNQPPATPPTQPEPVAQPIQPAAPAAQPTQPLKPPIEPAKTLPLQQKEVEETLNKAAEKTREQILSDPAVAQTFASTPELQNEVVEIEKNLLNEIVLRLDQDRMSQEEAQKLAKEFLSYLPIQDQKDLLEKLKKLSQANIAAQAIYLKYAKVEEENETQKKLELMTKHLQDGNIEHALSVAKGDAK